jgi:hypothetical protein
MNKPIQLLVMRLSDMTRVHPDQIVGNCSKCDEIVGIYPSGQEIMRTHPGIELVCQVCELGEPVDLRILAPGAEREVFESKRKK